MISEQELDNILFLEFSDISKSEQKRMREDTLKFNAWLEGRGKAWPSAEDFAGYVNERKRRVGKKESQPYAAADKAGARVSAIYEAIARQKGENSMSEDFKATQPEDSLDVTEATPEATAQPVHEPVQGVRRGRKSKPEADRRSVKISIYLTPSLYEGAEELAHMMKQDLSSVIFSLLEGFVGRNTDKLRAHQDFLDSLGVIK